MNTKEINYSEKLTENQLKAIAVLLHENDDFFILEIGDEAKIFEGTEEEAREQYKDFMLTGDENEGEEPTSFEDWAEVNLTEVDEYDEDDYNHRFMVLTDEEADEKAAEYIKDSLWAFNPSFLSGETGIDQSVFEAIAENGKCESNNDAIESIIEGTSDMDSFVEAAISADGRGHFLNTYDGEENEVDVNGTTFYLYRIN